MLSYSTQYSDVSVPDTYRGGCFPTTGSKGGREALYVYTVVLNSWYYYHPLCAELLELEL